MHFYTFAFILALLAFGGVAAYVGDIVGYRLGRKRLTLFGLRPRTTATLIGVLAGVLIPAVTVAVGAWQISAVRVALFDLQDIRQEVQTLTGEKKTLQHERDVLREGQAVAQQAARQAQAEAAQERTRLDEVQHHLDSAQSSLSHAQSALATLRSESGRLRTQSVSLSRDLQNVRADLVRADGEVKAARTRLVELKLTGTQLEAQVAEKQKQVNGLTQQVEKLTTELQTQEARLIEEGQAVHNLFASRRPILDLGTELVRAVVTRTDDVEALLDRLAELLVLAGRAAESWGAAVGENGRYVRAVGPTPADAQADQSGLVSEDRIVRGVARQLLDAPEDEQVLRVIVVRRTFAKQQVYVVFDAQPNVLVYRKGETIVQHQIAPRQDDVDAFEQLWWLIADPDRSEVRRQAQAAGLLAEANSKGYGKIQIRDIYEAAAKCANRETAMTVRVKAADDTYTKGPLAITIDVSPASGG